MEELPGPDAFPMDLPAIISNFYARDGYVYLDNGNTGSVTFIGTVSPAGGNLKEPVTESTKKVARCFYALSQDRADSKRYPAIDAVESYSKYIEYPELQEYVKENISDDWVESITLARDILIKGKETQEQINILGDDSVPIDYHQMFWKSEVIDFVILQQDAFDPIDASTPIERQRYMMKKVLDVNATDFEFESFEEVNPYFKRIINIFKQINYSEFKSESFKNYEIELETIINERKITQTH
jgi:V/A-type H+-transporting ATPase subunit A